MDQVALITATVVKEGYDIDAPLLKEACRKVHIELVPICWDVNEDGTTKPSLQCNNYDFAIIRSVWNYHEHVDIFKEWLAAVTCKIVNPANIVAKNVHKGYLQHFRNEGVPIVPTAFFDRGATVDLNEVAKDRNWDRLVIKPAVSAGSDRTKCFTLPAQATEAQSFLSELLETDDVLIQRYMPDVAAGGERSYTCINGKITHSVRRNPTFDGDEIVMVDKTAEQADDEVALVRQVLDSHPQTDQLFYARVDMIKDERTGQWCLSELELIEPYLHMKAHPPCADIFASALRSWIDGCRQ
eukprot:TRINITY_DN12125_c0_g1_i5.p1 TRINITY_DN12125_c0_g1~~TRINITY_DN12125_c0_g1_i5.p1  ORF type:complete len:298 (+),score=56.30 TRINITY_DN12125_c0_g1_i5:276-1169(+)